MGFSCGASVVKNLPANEGDARDNFNPGVEKFF